MQMTTILEETKIVIMKKAEKGIYDVQEVGKAIMDNVTFNTDHLLHAVNSPLKNIRTLVEVKVHMMVSLKSCISGINSQNAQLFVMNLCHLVIAEVKKTDVALVDEKSFSETVTDNQRMVLAYVAGHCFQNKYKNIFRPSYSKKLPTESYLAILEAPKIGESSNPLYNLVNDKNRSGSLWLVSESTVAMFEHIEVKLRALFTKNPRKISDKKLTVLFFKDSCVKTMIDFLEEFM